MGGEPYWYFVPYQPNIQAALDALRAREFKAGRYNPVLPFQRFPVDADSPLHALGHALLSVGHLAERKRDRWRTLFDHYAFHADGDPAEHIPEKARGILATSTSELRQFLRQFLITKLMGR